MTGTARKTRSAGQSGQHKLDSVPRRSTASPARRCGCRLLPSLHPLCARSPSLSVARARMLPVARACSHTQFMSTPSHLSRVVSVASHPHSRASRLHYRQRAAAIAVACDDDDAGASSGVPDVDGAVRLPSNGGALQQDLWTGSFVNSRCVPCGRRRHRRRHGCVWALSWWQLLKEFLVKLTDRSTDEVASVAAPCSLLSPRPLPRALTCPSPRRPGCCHWCAPTVPHRHRGAVCPPGLQRLLHQDPRPAVSRVSTADHVN